MLSEKEIEECRKTFRQKYQKFGDMYEEKQPEKLMVSANTELDSDSEQDSLNSSIYSDDTRSLLNRCNQALVDFLKLKERKRKRMQMRQVLKKYRYMRAKGFHRRLL